MTNSNGKRLKQIFALLVVANAAVGLILYLQFSKLKGHQIFKNDPQLLNWQVLTNKSPVSKVHPNFIKSEDKIRHNLAANSCLSSFNQAPADSKIFEFSATLYYQFYNDTYAWVDALPPETTVWVVIPRFGVDEVWTYDQTSKIVQFANPLLENDRVIASSRYFAYPLGSAEALKSDPLGGFAFFVKSAHQNVIMDLVDAPRFTTNPHYYYEAKALDLLEHNLFIAQMIALGVYAILLGFILKNKIALQTRNDAAGS